jgi:polyisoprenoid-binding protein YceI
MKQRLIAVRLLAAVVAMVSLAGPRPVDGQQPAPVAVSLTPGQTAIRWTLGTTLHTVHGTFKLKDGAFRVDPVTGDASGALVVDAASGESGDGARDKHMRNDVLESAQYPTITFHPKHVSGKVDLAHASSVTLDGMLNLHGADHPLKITVDLKPTGSGVALAAHFTVPYVAWGMKDPSRAIFRVDKQVTLDVDASFPGGSPPGPAKAILHPGEVHTAQ